MCGVHEDSPVASVMVNALQGGFGVLMIFSAVLTFPSVEGLVVLTPLHQTGYLLEL